LEVNARISAIVSGGDILNNAPCEKFYSYWKANNYSGFPSDGNLRPRAYVPHLIDAVQTYFLIIDNLIKANLSVTKDNVLQALNGSGPGFETFEGCSGTVSFDTATGSRSVEAQVPQYDLVSLAPDYWHVSLNQLSYILALDRPRNVCSILFCLLSNFDEGSEDIFSRIFSDLEPVFDSTSVNYTTSKMM